MLDDSSSRVTATGTGGQQTRRLAERLLERDLLASDGLLREPEPQEEPEPAAPHGYKLLRRLGRGGGGVVYLARDARLDRQVAIKFLNDARRADLERFRREARFTARLNDPAIVQVYELGESDDRPYIAMQYIDGVNLGIARLETTEVVRVLRDVAIALKHAHSEGIVHRDIKPENILLDRDGRAYLTDFGIARNLRGTVGDTISSEGQIVGTPGLMPPEQARGEIQAVDARSDIYALGATLYLKLTGHYPFEGPNLVDVLHAVIHEAPPLLRARNAAVPRRLEAIAVRCMQKAREDRYQTIDEVVADFDRFLAGGAIGSESSAWFRRLVGTVKGIEASEPVEDLAAEASIGMEIVREISSWDANLYRVSGSLVRSFSRLDDIRRRLDEILAARPETAWARFYRGVVHFRHGRLGEAMEDMERSIDRVRNRAGAYFELGRLYIAIHLRQQHLARTHLSQVGVRHDLASSLGRLDQAVVALREAQRLGGDVPGWLDECTNAVSRLAESDYDGCVAICDRILADEPDLEAVWKLRGDAQRFAGGDPFESYDRALAVRRSYFEALLGKADAHLSRGALTEAREALDHARRIHPRHADSTALLARTYLDEARRGAGGEALETGLRLAREAVSLDARHYDAAITLAELQIEKGRMDGSDGWLLAAGETLAAAKDLEGCPNRVNLLSARAELERARQARARGDDPAPLIEAVLDRCRHEAAMVSDSAPWDAVRAEAEAERVASD